ncbi:NAD(P)H-binding protein [Nocardioides sp. zg-536]|uniref:NAD(P)H-binding protein n=1 Tax=Nocardioides faecalis TaxID=2803858 RepID=A0A938YCC8_9ACTN|nr:NAD(P)H-binding protein [Nocardioides faecalis]MBM9461745.1 NAD(P)H-binding protein [Nocardioides faecalis]MBS4752478.1 NAD(P)H-binding protein [Nocardioides faecalis]QVI57756.1 NAD(P)H-binding protein [Nocardioides faecalis]
MDDNHISTKIAVAGGTGLLGRLVTEEVRVRGLTPVVIARSHGIDLTTGAGLDAALADVDAVVDASNVASLSARRSIAFFTAATTNLLAAEQRAGVRHHVAVSVVGCDRVDLPYYLGKRRQEELVAAGGVPWSLLRATQFHEFAAQVAGQGPPLLAPAPRMRCRPVAAREVAAALVDAAVGPARGRLPDLAGPGPERLDDLVRRVVHHRRMRRVVVPVPLVGAVGRQVSAGGLLPDAPAVIGRETWTEWLARA